MPKPSFPANAGGLSKFDRASIMKAAWRMCRRDWTFGGVFCFRRELFAKTLKQAWFEARQAAGVLSETEVRKAARIEDIRIEIEALQYKTARYDIGAMRQRLDAELASLMG